MNERDDFFTNLSRAAAVAISWKKTEKAAPILCFRLSVALLPTLLRPRVNCCSRLGSLGLFIILVIVGVNDYRAVDSQGNTLEFLLSPTRDAQAAKRFFAKALAAPHTSTPRVITVDKNPTYPKAFKELKAEGVMPGSCELRQSTYLNNLVEQDHRFVKRLVKLGMGFFSFETA